MDTKNVKFVGLFFVLFACTVLRSSRFLYAQPYGFSARALGNGSEIVKTDLANGQKSHFLSTSVPVLKLFWDPSQQWVFHIDKDLLVATKVSDTANSKIILAGATEESFFGATLVGANRLIMIWTSDTSTIIAPVAVVLDAATLSLIDSLPGHVSDAESPFLSLDESRLYYGFYDTTAEERYLETYSLASKSVLSRQRLYDIGPPTNIKIVEDGKRGKALVSYSYPTSGNSDNHFLVYDPATSVSSSPSSFPYRERACLSTNASYIISQRVELDSLAQGWRENRTGEVWVFNSGTGLVWREFIFPGGGEVVVFQSDSSHFYYHIDSSDTWLRAGLVREPSVKGGIAFATSFSSLSVKAKPSDSYGVGDSIRSLMATVRWPSKYNITLGTVTSTYGFAKVDAPVTVGSYTYQKFRTTTHAPISWQSGQEHTLFSVPVSGACGAETFELTNALSGGEWFVDINYLDKTDTTFYAPVARSFAFSNKADNSGSTYYNGARHMAVHGRVLHEVYYGSNEIIYRRKNLDSTSWEQTTRLSRGNGSNTIPNILVAHDGSVHVVWQRMLNSSTFALWYRRSTDGGNTWSSDTTLVPSVTITQSNQWNIYPVIAELGTTKLVVVCCSSGGLRYTTSANLGVSWADTHSVATTYPNYIWFPSLAPGSNYLILTYDKRYYGLCSKTYNGTNWSSTEQNIASGIGTIYDRLGSVVVDPTNAPMAAWCAQRNGQAEYRIVYRAGVVGGGSWSSGYTEFPYTSTVSDYYPSIAYNVRPNSAPDGMEVVWYNSKNEVKIRKYYSSNGWADITRLDTAANWANVSIQEPNTDYAPVRAWTNFSGTSPYEVKLSSDDSYQLQSLMAPGPSEDELYRRVTVESEATKSFVSYELAPIKVVTSAGDTTVLPFKTVDQRHAFTASVGNAWDYLGTGQVKLPTNAQTLVLDASVATIVRDDSLGTKGTNGFDASGMQVQLIGKGSKTSTLLNEGSAQSGRKVM